MQSDQTHIAQDIYIKLTMDSLKFQAEPVYFTNTATVRDLEKFRDNMLNVASGNLMQ